MQISSDTISILKNFSAINNMLLLREGNVIHTISAGSNVFARATVAEEFPKEVAIYDLPSLLGILTLTADMDVDFEENSMHISKDGGTFEYFYAEPEVMQPKIDKWPTKSPKTENVFSFSLTAQDLQTLTKSAGILDVKSMVIEGDGKTVTLKISDPKMVGSNSYRRTLGDTDKEFKAVVQFDNLRVIPDSYDLNLSTRALHFSSTTRDLQYWFALDPESKMV